MTENVKLLSLDLRDKTISATRLLWEVKQSAESGCCLEKCWMASEQWLLVACAEPFAFILLKCCKTFEYLNSVI